MISKNLEVYFNLSILVRSKETSIDEITSMIGLNPNQADMMFSKAGGKVPKANMWWLYPSLDQGRQSLMRQWELLKPRVVGRAKKFAELPIECEVKLDIVVNGLRPVKDFLIPGYMLGFAKDARCDLSIYFYDFSQNEIIEDNTFN